MRVMMVLATAALAWFGSTGPSAAADAANGLRIAQRWCSQCHLVSPDQVRASDQVLSFEAMARKGWTESSLAAFLSDPHPKMPNMTLSRAEIGDLVAYITSRAAR